MSIISLPRQHLKHHRDEAALLAPATKHAAPAAHLAHSHRDRAIDFDDIDFDAPAAMPEDWQPARGADKLNHRAVAAVAAELRREPHHLPADLVPPQLMRTVPLVAVVRDRLSVVLWDIAAAYIDAGEPHAVRAVLASIVEQLADDAPARPTPSGHPRLIEVGLNWAAFHGPASTTAHTVGDHVHLHTGPGDDAPLYAVVEPHPTGYPKVTETGNCHRCADADTEQLDGAL